MADSLFPPDEISGVLRADVRGGGRGRPRKEIVAVNAYQRELEESYDEWADTFSDDLAEAKNDETDTEAIIAAGLIALLLALQESGRHNIPKALFMALGDEAPTPGLLMHLADAV